MAFVKRKKGEKPPRLEDLYNLPELDYDAMPEAQPGPHVRTPLRAHQRKALWWMRRREAPPTADTMDPAWRRLYKRTGAEPPQPSALPRGGLLLDSMGFGKTLAALAVMGPGERSLVV